MVATDELAPLIRQQLEELLAEPQIRSRMSRFTPEHEDRLDWLEQSIRGFQNDFSLGRVLDGPLWLSGTSVMDGTVTADKLLVNTLEAVTASTGTLNVTGTITAAAAFPATGARIVINSSGLWGYSGAVTTTFKLNTNGSGEIGSGSDKISWTTGGVLSVPAAIITSLTIADVGGGTIGGTYQTSGATTRMDLSTSGIIAYASGTETFRLNATTGAVTATGSFTIKSAASGARVEISNAGGIEGFNSGGTSTFLLNAATGAGRLGISGSGLSWDSAGAVTVNGSLLVTGTVTAEKVTSGTINNGSAATVNLGAADVVVNSTGKLKFGTSSADYLSNDLLHFEVSSGGNAVIEFKDAANSYYGQMMATASSTISGVLIAALGPSSTLASVNVSLTSTEAAAVLQGTHNGGSTVASVGVSATSGGAGNINLRLGDAAGTSTVYVLDSGLTAVFGVNSDGALIRPITNDATALGAYHGRVPIYINGSLKYFGAYDA